MSGTATDPLRIGMLGAARIAPLSVLTPASITGDRVVVVAARSRDKAQAYAAEHGIERVAHSYAAVLADDEVEAVYNPLANGLHGPWNLRAVQAGKHLMTEKPSAANAAEARIVADAVAQAGVVFLEAFHYPYHPLFTRVLELLDSGAIGEVTHIDVPLLMPDPGADDPRWVFELAGGANMDLGCYSLSCLNLLGERYCGGSLGIESARATERAGAPGLDEEIFFAGSYPSGATGSGGASMAAEGWSFTLVITGTQGEIVVPKFPLPNEDDRLIMRSTPSAPRSRTHVSEADDLITERDGDVVEHLGNRSSYTYQLEAFHAAVREGAPVLTDAEFAVRTMAAVDAAYLAAGLPLRPSTPID